MSFDKRRTSLKLRWLTLRARFSIPGLLANADERKVVSLVAATNGALAILIFSLVAWLSNLPLVFAALGPTAFTLFYKPFAPDAAPRSVVIGHFTAIAIGFAVHQFVGLLCPETPSLEHNAFPVFLSAAAVLALTCFTLVRCSCPHAPACGTALIITLGGAEWPQAIAMAMAVLVITAQAVVIHRLAGIRTPAWSPLRVDPQSADRVPDLPPREHCNP
ncbi:MAG: HPP family protein [Planctomycetota bacterium]|nr:HPP family protein [Planctomycetota bacterium]